MEKLELKHIAPYLPYKVKLMFKGKQIDRLSFKKYYILKEIQEGYICVNGYRTNNKSYLPILRPLSEIKQFEDIMDEFSEFSWNAFEEHFFCNILGRSLNCFDNVNYTIMELCFKHHLDIFGLIDKGLAVSYSDVESSSNEG